MSETDRVDVVAITYFCDAVTESLEEVREAVAEVWEAAESGGA